MAQYLSFHVNYIIIYYMLDCFCILFVFVLYNNYVSFTCVCVVVLCIGFVLSLYVFVLYCMSLHVLYCMCVVLSNSTMEERLV